MFSIANAVLYRPLPYANPDRVLTVRMQSRTTGELFTLVPADLVNAIQSDVHSVGDVARLEDGPNVTCDGPNGLTRIPTASVTANYFQVLRVVSLMVATRTREIGIRLALGSRAEAVVAHTVRRTLTPVVVGIVAGLIATRWLAGFVAAWLPARRAGSVEPMVVLKSE